MIPVEFEPTLIFESSFVQRRLIKLGYGNKLFENERDIFFHSVFILFGVHTRIQEEIFHARQKVGLILCLCVGLFLKSYDFVKFYNLVLTLLKSKLLN